MLHFCDDVLWMQVLLLMQSCCDDTTEICMYLILLRQPVFDDTSL